MSDLQIKPRGYLTIQYPKARRNLGIRVRASRALDIYTIPVDEFGKWRQRQTFGGSAFTRTKNLNVDLNSGHEFESPLVFGLGEQVRRVPG